VLGFILVKISRANIRKYEYYVKNSPALLAEDMTTLLIDLLQGGKYYQEKMN